MSERRKLSRREFLALANRAFPLHRKTMTILVALLILATATACTSPPPVTVFVTATPTNTPAPTNAPTPTVTPTPTLTPTPTHTPTPLPNSALLEPMNYQPQTYNNCGPASIAILLGYYDHWITQHEVNEAVSPGPSVCDIADYVSRYQLKARAYRASSHRDPIRMLLANGIPVIASQLLESGSDIGHYRVIKGYDDVSGEFVSDDPLQSKGPDFHIDYDTFARLSRHGAFIPVYPPEMDAQVRSLMSGQRGVLGVIREMLDHANNVDEAVAILQSHNIDLGGGPPIHYLIADSSGRSTLVEFYQGEMIVIPNQTDYHLATNFLRASVGASAEGMCWRYDKLGQRLAATEGRITALDAMDLLEKVSQGGTQWSVVYEMNTGKVNVAMGREYDDVHTLHLSLVGE